MTNVEFNQLVYTASKSLRYPALKFTNNTSKADILIDRTILQALSHQNKFIEGTNIKAWLYLIMKTNFEKDPDLEIDNNLRNNGKGYESITSDNKSLDEIRENINSLDKIFQEPFMMHFSGFKMEEIAERLRLPIGTVKNRIHVASKILNCYLRK